MLYPLSYEGVHVLYHPGNGKIDINMEPDQRMLQETYRLTQENNRMLHAMRRNAFWGGLFKFLIYAALLTAPVWFYLTYLNGAVQNLLQAVNKIQGTSTAAQSQFSGLQASWQQFEARFGFGTSTPPKQ